MAWLSRAPRETLSPPRTATAPSLGPGSYDTVPGRKPATPSPAPFSTTSGRMVDFGDFTPGPGEYKVQEPRRHSVLGAASLASKTARFADLRNLDVPGPGSYADPEADWKKRTAKKRGFRISQGHGHGRSKSAGAVSWVKSRAPPSIPAPLQSFGYEDIGGQLVMQPPPSRGFSGTADDSLGPDAYQPDWTKATTLRDRGVRWSKSRSGRSPLAKRATAPGPGAYDPKEIPGPRASRQLSSFASTVPRMRGLPPPGVDATAATILPYADAITTPGPGAYSPTNRNAIRTQAKPVQQQFFGSTVPRSLAMDPAAQKKEVPGPGSYELPSGLRVRSPQRTDTLSSAAAPPSVASLLASAPFHTTADRFQKEKDDIPGPGAYGNVPNLVEDLSKRQFGLPRPPGGTASRFLLAPQQAHSLSIPGPGRYTPAAYDPAKAKPASVRGSAAFASSSDRFRAPASSASDPSLAAAAVYSGSGMGGQEGGELPSARRDAATGLGLEGTDRARPQTSYRPARGVPSASSAFRSQSKRSSLLADTETVAYANLGPGAYDAASSAIRQRGTPASAVFKSGGARFTRKVEDTPPVGYYSPPAQSLIKPTFNVTIAAATGP